MTARGAAVRLNLRVAIEATADDAGDVTPRGVVTAAADESNPLHGEFEWNDGAAADKHRLAQARVLIREITIEVVDMPRRPISSVSFVHRPGSRQQAYIPLSRVAKSKKVARMVMEDELKRCESAIRRAREVADVIGLRRELDGLLRSLLLVRRKIAVTTRKIAA